jgi:hypothetical protein
VPMPVHAGHYPRRRRSYSTHLLAVAHAARRRTAGRHVARCVYLRSGSLPSLFQARRIHRQLSFPAVRAAMEHRIEDMGPTPALQRHLPPVGRAGCPLFTKRLSGEDWYLFLKIFQISIFFKFNFLTFFKKIP